jgi:cation diffusion facilitator CzcD-associated flavoprotein CzcO
VISNVRRAFGTAASVARGVVDGATRPLRPSGSGDRTPRVAILGAGASGILIGHHLRAAGVTSFTIYEKSDGVGGTWRDNTYPGAQCDIPSHLYSFSFAPNPDWPRGYSDQPDILAYLERCCDEFGLRPHLRFGTEITELHWRDDDRVWELHTADGDVHDADVVVSGLGQLNRPLWPDIDGVDDFAGTVFHSARWDHDHDLAGEHVAVIGNAASALQFIPEIAKDTAHLDVYQRSANWIVPKRNRHYGAAERWAFRHVPLAQRAHRWWIWAGFEIRYLAFRRPSRFAEVFQDLSGRFLAAQVPDPELRAALTPDYPLGCKRILASSTYYRALRRDDVDLVTTPIARITTDGVETADGVLHPADTIVFATGFDSTHFLAPLTVTGSDGRTLADAWHDGADAYLGMMVPGFPNLFMMYGPNTNLGHNSIWFMLECQAHWIMRCVERIAHDDVALDVTPAAMASYNDWVQATMGSMVWESGCSSWYKDASGKVTNNWPATTTRFWADTRAPDLGAFTALPARRGTPQSSSPTPAN